MRMFVTAGVLAVLAVGVLAAAGGRGQSASQGRRADTRIVFENNHLCWFQGDWNECGRGEIAVIRPDGTGFKRLTHNKVSEQGPAWSQDHRWIGFIRQTRPHWTVWVMDANGRHLKNLSQGLPQYRGSLDLSPQGRRLVVSAGGGESFHLYLVEVQTGKVSRLTDMPGKFGEWGAVWSPDGTRIAFVSNFEVWVLTLSNSKVQQLTFNTPGSGSAYPSWSPVGRRIVFERESGIWVMNADGSDAHPVLRSGGQNPTWSADGKWIVFSPYPQNGIRAVHPDGTGLHWIKKERSGWIDPLPNG